jgi:hypothetical protein
MADESIFDTASLDASLADPGFNEDPGFEDEPPANDQPVEPVDKKVEDGLKDSGAEEVLKVDARYAQIKVLPNDSQEGKDTNFPRNLHNAAELFLRVGLAQNAMALQRATEKVFKIYSAGPDGRTTQSMGRACVCWDCGHVGLPKNAEDCTKGPKPAGVCNKCEQNGQTNFVKMTQPTSGSGELPWMELKALAPEDSPAADDKAPTGSIQIEPLPKEKLVSKKKEKVKPNAPCPCGSGKKAKKCCHVGGI